MKKIKFILLTILFVFIAPQFVMAETDNKVNVYVFKSSTCPHCEQALNFFEELSKDEEYKNYFRLVPFETNGSSEEIKANVDLATKVAKYFSSEFDGVPLIVIGEKKFEGYASAYDEDLKEEIKKCFNDSCTDVVAGIQEGTLTTSSSFDTIFVILILVVIVGGVGYFIYIARQNPVEDDEKLETDTKEVTEEKVIEEKHEEFVKNKSNHSKKKNNTNNKKTK